jgi:S-adenosylmethionine:tRNA ribosyltransferase-isomerase
MLNTTSVVWETMIGNLKKWKEGEILQGTLLFQEQEYILSAKLTDRERKTVGI